MERPKGKNGVRHSVATKQQAIALRKGGKTHREIKKILGVSPGTAHLWTRGIVLTESQREDIQRRKAEIVFTPALRNQLSLAAREHLKPHQFKQKAHQGQFIEGD